MLTSRTFSCLSLQPLMNCKHQHCWGFKIIAKQNKYMIGASFWICFVYRWPRYWMNMYFNGLSRSLKYCLGTSMSLICSKYLIYFIFSTCHILFSLTLIQFVFTTNPRGRFKWPSRALTNVPLTQNTWVSLTPVNTDIPFTQKYLDRYVITED